jgi:hypothetical protein
MKSATILSAALLATAVPPAFAQPALEECFAWTREATGIDPAAEAARPVAPSSQEPREPRSERSARFSRGVAACLASVGYEVPSAGGYVQEPPSVLVVGQPVAFKPPVLPVSVICDDLGVVRVDDAGTFLWLTGVKPGETSCSLGSPRLAGRRALYHIVVRPASR